MWFLVCCVIAAFAYYKMQENNWQVKPMKMVKCKKCGEPMEQIDNGKICDTCKMEKD
jgi:predicted amidophosphoribosyltransferase